MKKRGRTEEDGHPGSIKPISKQKKRKLNPSGEEESKTPNPKPKAEKDNKITKYVKEEVKNADSSMVEKDRLDSYLPGQRHNTPHERDPFRIFLETLYQRIPENDLAASSMMEWGLLSSGDAKKVCDRLLEKQLHRQIESATSDVADARTTTLSDGNVDAVSGTVSRAKRKKGHKTSSEDAVSDLNSRKKKKNKTPLIY